MLRTLYLAFSNNELQLTTMGNGNKMQPLTLDTFNYKLIFLLCKFSPHSIYA